MNKILNSKYRQDPRGAVLGHFVVRGKRKILPTRPGRRGILGAAGGERGGQASEVEAPSRGPVGEWKGGPGGPEVRALGSRSASNKGRAEGRVGGGKDPAGSAAFAAGVVLPGETRNGTLDSVATSAASESCSSPRSVVNSR